MEKNQTQQLKMSLIEKRQNLAAWLEMAPDGEKTVQLGPADLKAVGEHIHILDEAVEKVEGGILGKCKVCGEPIEDELLQMDYTAEVCLSHLSPEEARDLERDLELSRVVQKALLPHEPPQIPGLELAAFNRPAQIVGGDLMDFLEFQDGKAGIVIADVAGKGLSASLIMASTQSALRTLVPDHRSPVDVLRRINRLIARNAHFPTFVTLVLGAYDPETHTFTYCNAGHNPPLLCRSYDRPELEICTLDPTGPAIGLLQEPPLWEDRIQLSPGDLLFFFTDGVSEAFNHQEEEYGMRRLEEFLRRNADSDPKSLVRALLRELQEFMGSRPPSDDITIIACRMLNE